MNVAAYILTPLFLAFSLLQQAKSQQIYEEKLNLSYYYSLPEHSNFFEIEWDRIDGAWLSFEKIGILYQTAIRDYLFAKIDSLEISRTDLLSISIIVDSSGKAVYCDIFAHNKQPDFNKLEQIFRYALH